MLEVTAENNDLDRLTRLNRGGKYNDVRSKVADLIGANQGGSSMQSIRRMSASSSLLATVSSYDAPCIPLSLRPSAGVMVSVFSLSSYGHLKQGASQYDHVHKFETPATRHCSPRRFCRGGLVWNDGTVAKLNCSGGTAGGPAGGV
jgi:hypothetical protein